MEAIQAFQELTSANEKEKVLQKHLFENLWLLDASWERAAGSERIEQGLKKMAKDDFDITPEQKEKIGRVDIRYATSGGQHVIVELKRYSVTADVDELRKQGGRYAVALKKVLQKKGVEDPEIEVIFVLGDKPKVTADHLLENDRQYINSVMDQINGRFVLYDELIENALSQYQEYLDASDLARKLDDLLGSIDDPIEIVEDQPEAVADESA